jgi:general secretion pathway protein K
MRSGVSERGVALISVMLIVALATALIYQLMTRHSFVVAKTRQTLYADQSLMYALGAEAFARQLLAEDWLQEASRELDGFDEAWSQPITPFEVDGGSLEIAIIDLDRRFNLNSLAGANPTVNLERFRALISALGGDPRLAEVWKDWIDADREAMGFGAEEGVYLLADPPYRTADQLADSVSELRLLEGVDAAGFELIAPFVTVLPVTDLQLNINTADAVALQSLSPRLSPARAQSLVESPRAYTDAQSLAAEVPEFNQSLEAMKVTSEFFEVHARAEIEGVATDLVSVLHRDTSTGVESLLGRDFGRCFVSPFELIDEDER